MSLRSDLFCFPQLFSPASVAPVTAGKLSHAVALHNVSCSFQKRRGVFKSYQHTVLHDVSLTIERSETLGILGANGAGKTTLLRVLAGALRPNSGVVESFGNRVALLSLQGGMLPYLSGRDNAVLLGVALGMQRRFMLEQLSGVAEYSGLGDAFYEPVRVYSSGMRARLSFAVALCVRADVLLVDEVLSVGDSSFREKSSLSMQKHVRSGKAAVIVSHNQQLLANLCSKIAILYEGRLSAPMPAQKALTVWQGLSGKR